ncbi:MAG: SDR family oxidoreductase [Pseudomonadales bacterium]|jgi:NAD(P)-dependent dehydrogenase (short-subunit alcohol dehydrogenase family)|nr:SDR family oxidoreductase [Pseudomonadales bacterium]MDP6472320.1 SDR family oxidoreductase [Pseudomonadales bacterium]MDP6828116.1 SDR family oxidoreductase [Pseudomonadales bacterium]MDP6971814.1 SDR family oxidoreductase [Pseudomonadales bacterium]|tara:strand:- start:2086 stop:2895 length:810 start_codon:yes stop_codon:yes gene_type:complete
MDLTDKTVLITGAGRGIGAGIASCFAGAGAKVAVTDLDDALAQDTASALDTQAMGLVADASSQSSMADCIERVNNELGTLDVLVNNAGVGGLDLDYAEVAQAIAVTGMSDEAWDEQLLYNLRTAFSSSNAAIPRMNDGGSIVNIASIAALGPSPDLPAYGAAKAGVVHLTKTLASQLAPRRIRVNCICPGLLWTRAWEMLAARIQASQPEMANMTPRQIFEGVVAQSTPLGGEQTPEDIGNLAVFYASDKARMITGQVVSVDGGITLQR